MLNGHELTDWIGAEPERACVDKGCVGQDALKPLRVFRSGEKALRAWASKRERWAWSMQEIIDAQPKITHYLSYYHATE